MGVLEVVDGHYAVAGSMDMDGGGASVRMEIERDV